MVYVYMACVSNLPDPKECSEILKGISQERCQRIHRQMQTNKRKQSIGAGLLLKKVLELHGVSESSLRLGEHGKPEADGIYFNLSHSGDFVVCAVSDRHPVGCDIELIKNIEGHVGERFFSSMENERLNTVSEDKRDEEFIRLWTLKESYLKMSGEGLKFPLRECELMLEGPTRVLRKGVIQPCVFKEYIVPGYRLAVCSEDAEFSDMVRVDMGRE